MNTTARPMAAARWGAVAPIDGAVMLGDGALGRWQRRNRATTIRHGIRRLETEGALDNLRGVAGESDAPFRGPVFADSDVHKVLEAVAWELGHGEDPELRAFYETTIALLATVQDADGYLDSAFQRADRTQERWSDFAWGHELYCAGHLIQAAIASARSLGDDRLLAIATRTADLIVDRFGSQDSPAYPGHPEVEYALIELFRLTGRRTYLDTAQSFIERRGVGWLGPSAFGPAYFQDDVHVRETSIMRGHAVRALYLNSGVADLYLETGDDTLLAALRTQWDDMVTRRSYLTGGTGSRHRDESFGDAYELPSDRAYAETCAGIGAMHWAWRMYTATGDARYGDFFETALYNVVADGTSEAGDAFFYSNPLQLRPDHDSAQQEAAARRLDWYFCACCPPNLMRTFASIEGYLAATRGDELQILNYSSARIESELAGGRVVLEVDTDYPLDGAVRVTVVSGFGGGVLVLRLPSWCTSHRVTVDGRPIEVAAEGGWLRLPGALATGSVVLLDLGMPVEVLVGNPQIDAVRGSVAVRRGPVVYCLEQTDNTAAIDRIAVDPALPISVTSESTTLGPILEARGLVHADTDRLYSTWRPAPTESATGVTLRLRPYATWGNGQPGAMRVWVPTAS